MARNNGNGARRVPVKQKEAWKLLREMDMLAWQICFGRSNLLAAAARDASVARELKGAWEDLERNTSDLVVAATGF